MRLDCWDADKSPAHAEAYREQCNQDRTDRLRRANEEYYNSEEYRIEQEKELERNRALGEAIGKLIAFIIIIHFKLMLFIVTKLIVLLIFLLKTNTGKSILEFLKNYLIMVLLGLRVLLLFPFLFLQSIYLEIFKKRVVNDE